MKNIGIYIGNCIENLDIPSNYAAKFSGHGEKKVVKSRRNFIYKKRNPGRIGFHISEKRKEFFSQKHPLGRRMEWVLLRKVQIAYLELYPLESGKAYGLVRHRAHYGTRRPHAKNYC